MLERSKSVKIIVECSLKNNNHPEIVTALRECLKSTHAGRIKHLSISNIIMPKLGLPITMLLSICGGKSISGRTSKVLVPCDVLASTDKLQDVSWDSVWLKNITRLVLENIEDSALHDQSAFFNLLRQLAPKLLLTYIICSLPVDNRDNDDAPETHVLNSSRIHFCSSTC